MLLPLWYLASESALREKSQLSKSKLENTLYFRKTPAGALCVVLICQVGVYAGKANRSGNSRRFCSQSSTSVSSATILFMVYGSEFCQHSDKSVALIQCKKLQELEDGTRKSFGVHKRFGNEFATADGSTAFKTALGKMLFIDHMSNPLCYE